MEKEKQKRRGKKTEPLNVAVRINMMESHQSRMHHMIQSHL